MLCVTIEIWPFGDEATKRQIGQLRLGNLSDCAPISDYSFDLRMDDRTFSGIILGHERNKGALPLITEALARCTFTSSRMAQQPKVKTRRTKKTVSSRSRKTKKFSWLF